MEISDVRRRVRETIADARRQAAERRQRVDDANQSWETTRERVVLPIARQLAQVLSADGYRVQVSTPAERVLMSFEHRPGDFLELSLEPAAADAVVVLRTNRGRDQMTEERVLARGATAVAALTEEQVLDGFLTAAKPWFER